MTNTVELFTLRLWQEATGGEQVEWRGKIEHVRSGQVRYFRDWRTLQDFLLQVTPKTQGESRSSVSIAKVVETTTTGGKNGEFGLDHPGSR